MEIRGVGGINPLDRNHSPKTTQAPSSIKSVSSSDSLRVSDEARFLEDEAFVKEVLAKIPDIDQERINNVKKNLESGYHNNKETLDKLTDKLLKALGI